MGRTPVERRKFPPAPPIRSSQAPEIRLNQGTFTDPFIDTVFYPYTRNAFDLNPSPDTVSGLYSCAWFYDESHLFGPPSRVGFAEKDGAPESSQFQRLAIICGSGETNSSVAEYSSASVLPCV